MTPNYFANKDRCRRQPPFHVAASELDPKDYIEPYLDFMNGSPTVFHAVDHYASRLKKHGFKELSERASWADHIREGGKYFVQRNGSSLIAFVVGGEYEIGNGAAIIAGHIDALTARCKLLYLQLIVGWAPLMIRHDSEADSEAGDQGGLCSTR